MLEKSRQAVKLQAKCENCGKKVADGVARERWPFSTGYCACALSTPALPEPEFSEAEPLHKMESPKLVVAPEGEQISSAANETSDTMIVPERFELVEKLGEGGMGAVFCVRDKGLNQLNAIKFMKPEIMKDRAAVKRFEKEAAAVSDLTHPNIAQVFGCDTTNGAAPYLMMEYVDGISLAELLKHEKFIEQARAIEIFLQVCEALEHAHRKGVVHRDLSPANILIVEHKDGTDGVKIVDFGIAKLAPVQGITELTQNGDVLGSPKYMSPEQARGDKVDQRFDIYSMGCVMYEALAGKPLFVGVNGIQILMHHLSTPIKYGLTKLRARGVNDNLIAIIAKMLSKNADKRYQSATEVRDELARIKAKKIPRVVIRKRFMIVAGLASIFVATNIGMGLLHSALLNNQPDFRSLNTPSAIDDPSAGHSNWTIARPADNNPESWFMRIDKAYDDGDRINTLRQKLPREEVDYRTREKDRIVADTTEQLRRIGPSVIPALIDRLGDRHFSQVCNRLLVDFGQVSVKPLIDQLRGGAADHGEMNILSSIGRPAAAEAISMIGSSNQADQKLASKILSEIVSLRRGRPNRISFPGQQLSEKILSDDDLSKILRALNQGNDIDTKSSLLQCLAYFGPGHPQIDSALANALQKSNDSNVRLQALRTLGAILTLESPDAASKTLPLITKILVNESDSDIRLACIQELGELGDKAEAAIPALKNATHDPVDIVRKAAIKALCKMAETNSSLAPDVIKALNDSDPEILNAAMTALPKLGAKGLPGLPRLLSIMANDQSNSRWRAIMAVQQLGPEAAPKAVPVLIKCLETGPARERMVIISALGNMGAKATTAIPLLKKIADDTTDPASLEAQRILREWNQIW